ncbi:MAG: glycosyl hydrolase family 88 [Clostridia bacterium]|jgi:rhamnogalacturonyl hydrolase YesR|nr:glycosyl hydrolase family 88 [Clostridia bacterium]
MKYTNIMIVPINEYKNEGLNSRAKKNIILDENTNVSCLMKFDISEGLSSVSNFKDKVIINNRIKVIKAYLRLVNASGHMWTTSGIVKVQRLLGSLAKDSRCYVQEVFRIPQWQPTWFVDITQIIEYIVENPQENYGISVTANTESREMLHLYNDSNYLGLKPMIVVEYTDDMNEETEGVNKVQAALAALKSIYLIRDLSWSGSFVRNAQVNMHKLTQEKDYLNALRVFFDYCIDEEGNFSNVSEEYFYVAANGAALIYLYEQTQMLKYKKALDSLRDGIFKLPISDRGIIMAGDRTEVELIYCVCSFLAAYGEVFKDRESLNLCMDQTLKIYEAVLQGQLDGIPLQNLYRHNSKGWSRGMGWIVAGMGKILCTSALKNHNEYDNLKYKYVNLCSVMLKHQHHNGMFTSIIQDTSKPYEVTGSCLIGLGFELGVRGGILSQEYRDAAIKTVTAVSSYSKTGIDMGQSFPMNFFERYEVTDFTGYSDQGFGTWMELYSNLK